MLALVTAGLFVALFAVPVSAGSAATYESDTSAQDRLVRVSDVLALEEIGGYAGTISVSPDGSLVAWQSRRADFAKRTYVLDWWVARTTANSKPVHLGTGGELILNSYVFGTVNGTPIENSSKWSPNGEWVAYVRKEAGEVQLWRSRTDGTRQEQVSHNPADVLDFAWSLTGNTIYFQVGRHRREMNRAMQDEGDQGYLLDDRFMPEYSTAPLWSACGRDVWSTSTGTQECTPELWMVELGARERRATSSELTLFTNAVSPKRPRIDRARDLHLISWDRHRRHAAWTENMDSHSKPGPDAARRIFVDDRQCPASECGGKFEGLWWNGKELIFLRLEGHARSIPAMYGWQPGTTSARLIHRLDGVLESCTVAQGKAICLHETPKSPRKIVSIDLSDGSSRTVFDPNPEFARFDLGAVERLEWTDAFGNETFGHLAYPPNYQAGHRYPLVVVQYRSRGFLKSGTGEEYPIYPLAARGFLVLSFDRPEDLSLGSKYKRNTLADLAAFGAQQWKDGYTHRQALTALERIVDALIARGIVDPTRVGITGLSNGAETVEFALLNSQRFAAASHSGIWSPLSYYLTAKDDLRAFIKSIHSAQTSAEAIERWNRSSLMHNAHRVSAPLLIQVSDRELITALPAYVALRDARKPVEAYVFPNEFHIKWQPQHKLAVAERAIDWFSFWLNKEEDENASKAQQYVRWRKLRALQEERRVSKFEGH